MHGMRRALPFLLAATALVGIACNEEGDIKIASLTFEGVEQVDKGDLANALQTKEGSWLPWGRQYYFDRRAFDADLQRIEAFYRDRGFPDARVTSVDPKLNEQQTEIDITVQISEGEPIRIAEIELVGFDVLPADRREQLLGELGLEEGQPLDIQVAAAARERSVNVRRDHG